MNRATPQFLNFLTEEIKKHLDPQLLNKPYKELWEQSNLTFGFCALASEVAWFILGGKEAGWTAYNCRDTDNTTHWWLEHKDGKRFDPTREQYTSVGKLPPYDRGIRGRPGGFMGIRRDESNQWGNKRKPSIKASILLEQMEITRPPKPDVNKKTTKLAR